MTLRTIGYEKTNDVVEGSPSTGVYGVSHSTKWVMQGLYRIMCVMLAVVLWITTSSMLFTSTPAMAAGDSSDSSESQPTFSQDIIDPENVLGSDVASVTDAMKKTKDKTGVTVKLSYLTNFSGAKNPDAWAQKALDASDPKPNTVLLAAALNDGRLVVAISSNSDDWLLDKQTASQLSQAALDPIVSGDSPDWSASAIAMMDMIATLKQTSTRKSEVAIGVAAMGGVLVALIAIVVVVTIIRRRREVNKDSRETIETDTEEATSKRSKPSRSGSARRARRARRSATASDTTRADDTANPRTGTSSADSASENETDRFNAWLASIASQDAQSPAGSQDSADSQGASDSHNDTTIEGTADVQETSSTARQAGVHE
ncbi:hypothetical protein D2E25_1116 [Bifidobacterium goeldii]|uniref:TPM domain-containing protein n=1 Tax=Bifidobacterium goeldii TaxID=2306975 RepID=A0A430FJT8_9BIFI|nr:hypothetical protein [Bifidobacterium goeldii]RSX53143.1 hypothetical protein D2E25_1116 [Bifidobacterium goeldii]